MRRRVAVYPYTGENFSMFAVSDIFKSVELVCGISPIGFGYKDKKIECGSKYYPIYSNGNEIILERIDEIFIMDSIEFIKMDEIEIFLKEIPKNIKLVYCSQTNSSYFCEIKRICKEIDLQLVIYNDKKWQLQSKIRFLKKIEKPVITVYGMSVCTNKFDIQLYLRKYFVEKGYSVEQIGTKIVAEYLDFHKIPDWFFQGNVTEMDKILYLNDYIYQLSQNDIDLIIIGVPGGIMPLSQKHHFEFGIYAYEISCSCKPDYAILSLPYAEYNEKFAEEMRNTFRYKLNCEVDAFLVSEYRVVSNSVNGDNLEFVRCIQNENKNNIPGFYSFEKLKNGDMVDDIINKIGVYGQFTFY